MAYLLRLATNGYAQLASTFSVAGTSSLSIKFKAAFTSGIISEIYGLGTSTAERLQYNGTGFFFRLNGTNGNTITTATIASLVSGYSVSNANEYELRKILFEDGSRTRYRLFVNGVDCGILMSIFGSGGDTFQFSRIGSASTAFMNGDLYYMDCFIDGVKTRSYDPSATGGSGSTLVDTTGSQNGALNGTFTWVFYSSGASNAITVSATLPKITGSLTLNEINPSYVISVNGQLPKITGAVALNEINPVFTVAVAGQLPKLTSSIALNQFASNRQVTVNGLLPKLTGAVTLNRIQPNNQASVSGQLPRITASITLRVPESYPAANPNDYTVSAYLSADSTYTARLSEISTINAIISASSTFSARLN